MENYIILHSYIRERSGNREGVVYCLSNDVLKIVTTTPEEYRTFCYGEYREWNPNPFKKLIQTYNEAHSQISGFIELSSSNLLIRKLWTKCEGLKYEHALEYLQQNINSFQGREKTITYPIEPPTYGMIIRTTVLPLRRFSDNKRENTFDIVEVHMLTIQTSKGLLTNWYVKHIDEVVRLAIKKIGENHAYLKKGIPTDYLKLDHIGIGKNSILLTFVLKKSFNELAGVT